jgi:ATP-binding cassette subfamily C protein LapB
MSNKNKIVTDTIASKLSRLTLFMILIAGGYLITKDAITFGQITACAMLGGRAISPVLGLMRVYQQTKDIKILRKRIDEIAYSENQYSDDIPNFPDDIYGAIEFIDLSYKDVQNNIKETITIDISAGDFVVINPTTFPSYRRIIQKINGFEPIEDGKILIDSLDISEWNMLSLKGKIECLTENVSLFKGNVLENITYFNTAENQNAFEAASLTGLDLLVSKMPEGFATELDSHMLNYLSAAFLQRLNLSRSLLERPRILIIDRIDEGMDRDTLKFFLWLLNKLKGKSTIIIASWNKDILDMGDYELMPEKSNIQKAV